MKTEPNESIEKLSEAMRHGLKIAKENGIKHSRGYLFTTTTDGNKIDCACALGMAYIGIAGTEPVFTNEGYEKLDDKFDINSNNSCLLTTIEEGSDEAESLSSYSVISLRDFVVELNDTGHLEVEEIAAKLETCGL
jgi:hypothetical protein